jgi:hypothetical protein
MAIITRRDAFLMFGKWRAEQSLLYCRINLETSPKMETKGRIRRLIGAQVFFRPETGYPFNITIPVDAEFAYMELKASTIPELNETCECVLTVNMFYGGRVLPDSLTFAQLS